MDFQAPQGIDISAVREALARRAMGSGAPATQQISRPAGGSPLQAPPQVAPTGQLQLQQPQGQPQGGAKPQAAGGQGQAQPKPTMQPEEAAMAKALISKLLQYM